MNWKKREQERIESMAKFARLDRDQIKRIVEKGTYLTVPQDWSLMMEQTTGDKAYLILDGEVSIRHGKDEFARLGPGAMIGEVAIVAQKLRTATVVSLTPLEVLHFTADALHELEEDIPEFREALESLTAERLAGDP
jgi:CRP/FNR family transcriptional regulator, cyclic AMP receptor protein